MRRRCGCTLIGVVVLMFSMGSILLGVLLFAWAVMTSRSHGPGSGFRGYTTGFRIRLWMMYVLGVLCFAQGVVGIRWELSGGGKPAAGSVGK